MRRIILAIIALAFSLQASAQFTPGQILSAAQLNSALAAKASNAAAAITGGTISAADVSAAVTTPAGASTSRTLASRFSDKINVRDYGVKCDGATDDAAALNAVFATALNNKNIELPAGVCIIKSGLVANNINSVSIVGAGSMATQIIYTGTSTTTDLLLVSNAYNPTLKGLTVWSSTTMTAGSAIHFQEVSYGWIRDVQAFKYTTTANTLWNGLWIDQPNFVNVDGFSFQAQNDALAISALGVSTGYQYDVFVNHGKLSSSAAGLHIGGGVDNVHADNTEATQNTYNVLDDNAITSFKNQEIFLGPNFVTDQGQQSNYYINDALCNLTNYGIVSIAGPVTHAVTNDGITVNAFPSCELHVNSPYVTNNTRDGIRIIDTSAIVTIAPSTLVQYNGGYGINATASFGNLMSMGVSIGNVSGGMATNVSTAHLSGGIFPGSASATSMTASTATNCASVSLPAGVWDINGVIKYNPGSTTAVSSLYAGIGTSIALPSESQFINNVFASITPAAPMRVASPVVRLVLASAGTAYLIGQSAFSTSTMTCDGYIFARNVRY